MNHPRIQILSSVSFFFKCIALNHLPSRCVGWTDVAFHNVSKGSANPFVFSSIDVCFGIKFVVWPTVDYSNVYLDIEAFVVMLTVDVPNVDLDDEAFIVMITVDVPSVDLDGEAFVGMLTVDVPNVDLDGEAFVVMLTVDAPNEDSDVSAIIPVEPSSAISIICTGWYSFYCCIQSCRHPLGTLSGQYKHPAFFLLK